MNCLFFLNLKLHFHIYSLEFIANIQTLGIFQFLNVDSHFKKCKSARVSVVDMINCFSFFFAHNNNNIWHIYILNLKGIFSVSSNIFAKQYYIKIIYLFFIYM